MKYISSEVNECDTSGWGLYPCVDLLLLWCVCFLVQDCLPVCLMFDLKDEGESDPRKLAQMMQNLGVFISRQTQGQARQRRYCSTAPTMHLSPDTQEKRHAYKFIDYNYGFILLFPDTAVIIFRPFTLTAVNSLHSLSSRFIISLFGSKSMGLSVILEQKPCIAHYSPKYDTIQEC